MKRELKKILFEQQLEKGSLLHTKDIIKWFSKVIALVVPEYAEKQTIDEETFNAKIRALESELEYFININQEIEAHDLVDTFFNQLTEVVSKLEGDTLAIFNGDPAAKSHLEVRYAYPSFYAVASYRIAHELDKLGVTNIPRIISEHAHRETGIDIHPSAVIGENFCIDHGTGVVIGETTVIGNNVKIYQGVTLGALSVDKNSPNIKRHPSIGNDVVIYAGATILGGNTLVGDNSIIGGNVWLIKSVPAGSKIYYETPNPQSFGKAV